MANERAAEVTARAQVCMHIDYIYIYIYIMAKERAAEVTARAQVCSSAYVCV